MARYGNEAPSVQKSESLISLTLNDILNQKFGQLKLTNGWEQVQQIIDEPIVKWIKPPPLFCKVNSHENCIEGNCGASRVIRDCNGILIMAYSVFLGPCTSNWAKSRAMLIGLQQCVEKGYCKIITEADSKFLTACLNGEANTPRRMLQSIEEIQKIVNGKGVVVIRHCFREANKVLDNLAALSHEHQQHISSQGSTEYQGNFEGSCNLTDGRCHHLGSNA